MDHPDDLVISKAKSLAFVFRRQGDHLAFLLITLLLLSVYSNVFYPTTIYYVLWFGVMMVITHQVLVWLVFRLQLGWALLSRWFQDAALIIWTTLFIPFLIARVAFVVILARLSRDTLPGPTSLYYVIALILLIPALYTMYSVFKYFGFLRAAGGDHFKQAYRAMPRVKKGAFRWSSNAMYLFGFLLLWSIALVHQSAIALVFVLFQHLYIWVHYYTVEKPNMKLIYEDDSMHEKTSQN